MWNRDLIEVMLSLYGQHENLYNVRHQDYLDRVKRSNSLFEIYERLKEVNPKVTVEGIKVKIHGMRSQYLREVNEVKASKRSGAGADDVYVPKLWWCSQMEFLRPHVNLRPSSSNRSAVSILVTHPPKPVMNAHTTYIFRTIKKMKRVM